MYQDYYACLRHHGNQSTPDSKVHEANTGPIWGRQDLGGPHVGPVNLVIWDFIHHSLQIIFCWCQLHPYIGQCIIHTLRSLNLKPEKNHNFMLKTYNGHQHTVNSLVGDIIPLSTKNVIKTKFYTAQISLHWPLRWVGTNDDIYVEFSTSFTSKYSGWLRLLVNALKAVNHSSAFSIAKGHIYACWQSKASLYKGRPSGLW